MTETICWSTSGQQQKGCGSVQFQNWPQDGRKDNMVVFGLTHISNQYMTWIIMPGNTDAAQARTYPRWLAITSRALPITSLTYTCSLAIILLTNLYSLAITLLTSHHPGVITPFIYVWLPCCPSADFSQVSGHCPILTLFMCCCLISPFSATITLY